MRIEKASCIDKTCSVACSTSTGELHEYVYAPFGLFLTSDVGGFLLDRATKRRVPPGALVLDAAGSAVPFWPDSEAATA
jgi:hypothetical protein